MMLSKKLPLLAGLAVASSLGLSGCALSKMIKMAKDQQLTVVPSPLELHGDSVKFEMSAVLPVKMLKKNKTYTVSTTYVYTDQKLALPDLLFKASDYPTQKTEQPKISRQMAFGYAGLAMNRGDLMAKGSAASMNGKSKSTPDLPLAKGLITTSRLVENVFVSTYVGHGYNSDVEYFPNTVDFYFEQGSSVLRTKEIKGLSGKKLGVFMASKNPISTVTVTGSHSPEGREAKNTELSEQRAKAIEKYYRGQMKKTDYKKQAIKINFVTKTIALDWAPFKTALEADKKLTPSEKEEILAVVNAGGEFLAVESKLQSLSSYKYLFNNIYPKLRTANTEVLTILPKKSDAQIAVLAKQIIDGKAKPKSLSDKELAYAASQTPLLNEKELLYIAATKQNDSWAAHNNLGAIYLEYARRGTQAEQSGYVEKATTHLNLSIGKQESAEAYSNLATAALMKNDQRAAMDAITKAFTLSPSDSATRTLNALAGSIDIRKGQYGAAISKLNNAKNDPNVNFNKALALLLNKDYEAAMAGFEQVIAAKPDYALAHYAAAVTAARLKKEDLLLTNLRKAIALDANLRARAVNDLEFFNFSIAQQFKDAIR